MAWALMEAVGGQGVADAVAVLQENEKRVTALLETVARVAARLEGEGVRAALIEGGGVLLAAGAPVATYCSGDFDLLVDSDGWHHVRRILLAEGLVPADRRGRPTYREEFHKDSCDGNDEWIEVGCNPFDRMWIPFVFPNVFDAWLSRREKLGDGRFHVLGPEDGLFQVAVHTSLHSWVRAPGLRLHTDVDRLVRRGRIDWECFVREVHAARMQTRVAVSLYMAANLLDTPIPEEVITCLCNESRLRRLERILLKEGLLTSGSSKLGVLRTALVDYLVWEGAPGEWLKSIVVPESSWMRDHFDRGNRGACLGGLHVIRYVSAVRRCRPV